jgi:PIN domain nuclease of toxin-antitoxin system
LVWVLTESRQLGPIAKSRIQSAKTFVSSVSSLELTIKQMLGKIPELDWQVLFESHGAELISFAHDDARALLWFPALLRHDPFDRALVAHAASRGISLLTSDSALLSLGQPWILDSRE